jgi:hypothetical protein
MTEIPADVLAKWPRLRALREEEANLEKKLANQGAEVAQLKAALPAARDKNLDASAKAVRAGEKPPAAMHEPKAHAAVKAAEQNYQITQRALEATRADYAKHLARHQPAVYADVLETRKALANEAAEGARKALGAFGRWHEMRYVLRDLAPPQAPPQENMPARPLTNVMIGAGVQTTRSAGPDRGVIEQMLGYLISLAEEEAGEDAA